MTGRGRWHAAAGLYVAGMLGLAALDATGYYTLVQEDGPVEWVTVGLFAAAGLVRLRGAWRGRRPFDGLVAVFCLFVAGEEISWGQRLIGYTPPERFLAANFQQEANVHNFVDVFGRPGLILAALLLAYGVVLPAVARWGPARRVIDRVGASVPPGAAAPWFAGAAGLLVVYPVEFAGEWVEALAGGLFLATAPAGSGVAAWVAALALGGLMTGVSLGAKDPGGRRSACAAVEAEALLRDLVEGEAATARLPAMAYVHKRLYSAVAAGYIDGSKTERYQAAPCGVDAPARVRDRRRYGVDPWGMSYWVVSDARTGGVRVVVYSMGPNRRRDGEAGVAAGDDVVVYAELGREGPAASDGG